MRSLLCCALALASCANDEVPLSNATTLACPSPGALPFRLTTHGFQRSSNAGIAANNPRSKDEASDTIGNPSGLVASIYLPDDQSPTDTTIDYHGAKARTTHTGGLFTKPLAGEHVSLWTYDPSAAMWQTLGDADTDGDGYYDLPNTGFVAPNGQPIFSVLEADGSCAEHYDYLWPAGTKVVVADIDGTLTLSDNELLMEVADDTYMQMMMGAADHLMQAWAAKGYSVVYLTARPHQFRNETRVWLRNLGFPNGPVITAVQIEDAAPYKTAWMNRMVTTFGWVPVAVYGNADTDITAYEAAGVPKAQTFIVGPLAGNRGTVPIANMDFTDHIATYVNAQPNNP